MKIFANAEVETLFVAGNELGEGAFWDGARQRLLWVDILQRQVLVQQGSDFARYTLPVMPSVIWKVVKGQVYLATDQGVGVLDLADGSYRTVVEVEAHEPETRSNDGGVSSDGSFWFGTMRHEPTHNGGAIYRVAPDLSVTRMHDAVGIPNTFLFPSGHDHALIGDSFQRCIYRYAITDGRLGAREVWMEKGDNDVGTPDGSALICDSMVINAEWGGGRIVAYDMTGRERGALSLPVSFPTSCALGGQDGRTLFVTSAREGLTDEDLARQPNAGTVFSVKLPELPDAR
ncbi:MAG: SMP-30/gluconolactonase/LRE family protein [Spiribacter salinus]|uniref:SMP-30/gluconolactonase/LRE family protein n=1 Tax=Spiribacter salinus TaxID=1335746 RepID=A0A540VH32_9GAMM|nr:MAG: SMP-30/gluconolactonase/LRE family protein [Spiribacter salinus]